MKHCLIINFVQGLETGFTCHINMSYTNSWASFDSLVHLPLLLYHSSQAKSAASLCVDIALLCQSEKIRN